MYFIRLKEKEKLASDFLTFKRFLKESGKVLEAELHPEKLHLEWRLLVSAFTKKQKMVFDELER